MRIGIAGAGRTGCSLALALNAAGACIAGVYSRKPETSADIFIGTGIACEGDISTFVRKCDVIFLTVPDSAIASFATSISMICGNDVSGRLFLHCSGAMTSAELDVLAARGAVTGSLHPIQTFPDRAGSWESMCGIHFGFEGSDEALSAARETVALLKGEMLVISREAKPLYHAAACMLSNYIAALSHAAGKLLERAGIPKDTGMKAFAPLLMSTVENIIAAGSAKALTGPISRGDTATVQEHILAIGEDDRAMAEVYKVLGRLTTELALLKGSIDEKQGEAILRVLL